MWLLLACNPSDPPPEKIAVAVGSHPDQPTAIQIQWGGPVVSADYVLSQGHLRWSGTAKSSVVVAPVRYGEPLRWEVTTLDTSGRTETASGTLDLPQPPPGLPKFVVTSVDPARSEVYGGSLVLSHMDESIDDSWAVAVDGDGGVRFVTREIADRRITRARLSEDGRSVLFSSFFRAFASDGGGAITRAPFDGSPHTTTRAVGQHHDFYERDGSFVWISFDPEDAVIDGELLPVMADRVMAAPEGSEEADAIELWSFNDGYPVEPWWTCEHMEIGWWVEGYNEWTHSNSLVEAEDGGFYILARHIDALVRVSPSGEMLWQLGGRDSTLEMLGPEPQWSHPHFSWADGSSLLVYDNREHDPRPGRLAEYVVDEALGTGTLVWEWEPPVDVAFLGDIRLLPGGNLLAALGPHGRMMEITRSGEIVWDMTLQSTGGELHTVARIDFTPDIVRCTSAEGDAPCSR